MKVQILKSFSVPFGAPLAYGDVLSPPDDVALAWIRAGFAQPYGLQVETTSLAPAPETTSVPPTETTRHAKSSANRTTRR